MWNVQRMRLSGLASGMDTDTMVQNLMRVERLPLDRLYQQRQLLEWRRDDYRDITNTLRVFKEEYMDVLKSDTNMLSPNYFKKFTSTVTDELGKQSNAVGITAGSSAVEEDIDIAVVQLAKAEIWEGVPEEGFSKADLNKKISEFHLDDIGSGQTIAIKINKEDTITISSDVTLKELMSQVNSNTKADFTMRYNEITEKLEVMGKKTGADNTIELDGTLKSILGIDTTDSEPKVKAQDAIAIINGTAVKQSSNQFNLNGVTYQLNKVTYEMTDNEIQAIKDRDQIDNVPSSNVVKVSLQKDIDTVVDNIKTMLVEYNKIVELLNTKVTEKYDRDYPPLTSDQREAMDEKDIEKWEEKAKTGLLARDSLLQGILQDMRRSLSDPIDGVAPIAALRKMGIDTSKNYKDGGKLLIVDEQKLKDALAQDPDGVAGIFTKTSDISYSRMMSKEDRNERYNNQGLMQRLSDIINDNISTSVDNNGNPGKLIAKAGLQNTRFVDQYQLNDEMKRINTRMDELELKLYKKEEAYYSKFAAMESALAKMQNQASSLLSQLGMGS